ncbi:GntR family transcriptional regulator [Saccharopolyspora sp. K220]|uniref:GntR family transcriptional regulator n=1 Tax=Saccharopolyspora soli TaxID=2926618 RepID=UPI001F59BD60|nr:GntR family transcriptional regulator [Saccharopolyspora soli]MCI2422248.1 GntR family transcriptional regulator [Saccharopolyspora soli]
MKAATSSEVDQSAADSLSRRALLRVLGRENSASLVDEIIIKVGVDIIEGRLMPGDDLNSVELGRAFGTSRTPVREALLTLQREGFVDIPAHRRPRVATLSLDEVRDLYLVRAHLHRMVSRCVVAEATDDDLAELREVQARLRATAEAGDVDQYFWTNVEFRNTEARLSGNRTLCRVLDGLGLRMLQLRHLSLSLPGRMSRSLEDHERLLRAYEDRDADLAAALTASIVLRGLHTIEESGWVEPKP